MLTIVRAHFAGMFLGCLPILNHSEILKLSIFLRRTYEKKTWDVWTFDNFKSLGFCLNTFPDALFNIYLHLQ